ncbi:CRISPR-associated endoribonuclease Cas6 [Halegenticoccus tardaugens]|uniref:CRISPR-associated endoribonuclease Cas6 n=1 Tax=Halegenticoccus tardaugens TaxID=2071624 RepID=UPI00100A3BE8|nr:CRISPR-associated endoribonuclease Cas6 [Halegenticoccus tardaugens]
MRVLFDVEARTDAAYDSTYHHKLRGAIWNALEGSSHVALHDSEERTGLCYSNPFPWGGMDAGDERHILVSSPRDELLATIAAEWLDANELNVGEMPFRVTEMRDLYPDVGEPGSTGRMRTETGVYAVLPPQYEDDDSGEYETYWRPEHSLEPFQKYVEDQLQLDHDQFQPGYLPGPAEVAAPLFDEWNCMKTFSIPLTVTTGTTLTVVLSKWEFTYEVRDDNHRRHLNLALDTGIGGRNGYGLGFLNIVEREGSAV